MAQKNSIRLTPLINDLLDMEKLEAGQMRFDLGAQELGPLVRQSVQEDRAYAHRHGVRIECLECPAGVIAAVDGQRLLQTLSNLLSNAVKFSPDDVPVAFRDRIFGKFAQAHASDTRQKGGTGLDRQGATG